MITPRNMERVDEADEELLHDGGKQGEEDEDDREERKEAAQN